MLRLLLVDDEEIIVQGVRTMIEREQTSFTSIRCACSADEALALARQEKPDLIITDINMPGKSGMDLIELMKQEGLCDRFIILTGYDEFEYARQAIRLHVIDFLVKPINKNELISLLHNVSNQMQTEQRRQRELFALKMKNVLFYNADTDEMQMDAKEFELFFPHPHFQVMTIHSKEKQNTELTLSDYQQMQAFVRKQFPESFVFTSRHMPYIVFLFNLPQPLSQAEQKAMYNVLISNHLSKRMHLHLGFSSPCQALSNLHYAYIESLKASYLNVVMLKTPYAYFYSTDENLSAKYYERMIERLETSDEKKAVRRIENDINNFLRGKREDLSYAKKIYLYYLVHYSVYLGTFGMNGEEILHTAKHFEMLHLLESVDEIKQRILNWTVRVHRATKRHEPRSSRKDSFRKIEAIIHERYFEPLSLDLIADEIHLHPHYVSALFKKEKGIPFLQYVNQYRIEKAKQLLIMNSSLTVKDVWGQVGFESENHFYKLFKKYTGMTPRDYREQMQTGT